ncbi:hypothetical protein BgAZ_700030 (mitochondrion) [Babesia gibsoni]|uniref:Uncharacterized protein n=1 Tax=Babesia gibsoni TaxID=33632 RepID=A0AAD8PD21_BABGI|nr:hypothetical protein BgAZ_700030 [Babesia gibsoni]
MNPKNNIISENIIIPYIANKVDVFVVINSLILFTIAKNENINTSPKDAAFNEVAYKLLCSIYVIMKFL